jgi:acetyl-CoA carboxylase biotin carboxyl carrier protein
MAESSANHDVFDVRKIRRLVELMKEHDLTEMDLRQENMRIQLRRGSTGTAAETFAQAVSGTTASSAAEPTSTTATGGQAAGQPAAENQLALITSPIVGTFYASPDPEAPPYVKVGDHVGPETTVCIVEAMKVFNEIPAELSGKIVAVLARNGESVEYGRPLFKVDTNE